MNIKNELNEPIVNNSLYVFDRLPNKREADDIFRLIKDYSKLGKFKANEGKVSGTVYSNNQNLNNLMTNLFPIYYRSNPLHPDILNGLEKGGRNSSNDRKFISLSKSLCGEFTSGGTESIILDL